MQGGERVRQKQATEENMAFIAPSSPVEVDTDAFLGADGNASDEERIRGHSQ